LLSLACSSVAPPPPAPPAPAAEPLPVGPGDRSYLVDPLEGYAHAGESPLEGELRSAWRQLLEAGDIGGVRQAAAALHASDPEFPPALVLAAQVDLVAGAAGAAGSDRAVVDRLLPLADAQPNYTACQLLLGRAAEHLDDIALAYASFRAIAARSALALKRAGEMHPRAMEIVANRLHEAVAGARLEEAERHLGLLRSWGPAELATLEGARDLAVAKGDRPAELAAVRQLAQRRPGERALLERRSDLELEVGDPGTGLKIVQDLAARNPSDPSLPPKVERAKFRWRLSQLPRRVQAVAAQPEIDRADLAILLYWLVPEVRNSRPTGGRIATDVLDHPGQEEIVRVVNLELMDVDSTLHRFFPSSPVRLPFALRVVQRVAARFGDSGECGRGAAAAGVCDFAVLCGLTGAEDDCKASGPLSGGEAVELIRKALALLGGGS
jgi:tetratricopeptide (TPR) repeat protein